MLRQRIIFGPLMIAALLGIFYLDHTLQVQCLPSGSVILLLFLALIALGCLEIKNLIAAKGLPADIVMMTLAGFSGCITLYLSSTFPSQNTVAIFATVPVVLFVGSLLKHSWLTQDTQGAIAAAGGVLFVWLYLGILAGFFILIRQEYNTWVVLSIMLIAKSCDIGAYFTGRFFGRHKLIVWLSPKKTWEGLVGGMIFAGLVAMAMNALGEHFQSMLAVTPAWCFIVGMVLGLIGQFGDLTASLFKRDANIKDSGRSIPGFGGILDVIDSPLIVAPFAYWLLNLI